jgi:hypothetical protein
LFLCFFSRLVLGHVRRLLNVKKIKQKLPRIGKLVKLNQQDMPNSPAQVTAAPCANFISSTEPLRRLGFKVWSWSGIIVCTAVCLIRSWRLFAKKGAAAIPCDGCSRPSRVQLIVFSSGHTGIDFPHG